MTENYFISDRDNADGFFSNYYISDNYKINKLKGRTTMRIFPVQPKHRFFVFILVLLVFHTGSYRTFGQAQSPDKSLQQNAQTFSVSRYNVEWDSQSEDALGSMPLGNGDIGVNAWVEPTGDLVLLLSKTDAFDDFSRLLKLGRIRIKTTPSLSERPFSQTLRMENGTIQIQSGQTTVRLWVDANHPVVQLDLQSQSPFQAEVVTEIWRKSERKLDRTSGREKEEHSSYGNYPEKNRVNPDIVLPHGTTQLAWCHFNKESQWQDNLKLTGLAEEIPNETDPILKRTFGAIIRGKGLKATSDTVLKSISPLKSLTIQIFPLTKIAESPAEWLKAAEKQADLIPSETGTRFVAHQEWWARFWNRSWISVSATDTTETAITIRVTGAYQLQRFMNACAGRGSLPIKFNGTIFTVNQVFDPDFRRWGGPYWWQNTRLPYWGMLFSGDFDLMQPLFKMYRDALPLRKAATKKYYGHDGAFYPETMNFWGNYTNINYGIDRKGKPDGLTDNLYIRYYWQGGLELVGMMMDYYSHTRDDQFRDSTLLPLAQEIICFFDRHWQRGADGKVFYSPATSLETWHEATNPTPEIAGLRYLLPALLELPVDENTKKQWKRLLADQPEIPLRTENGQTRVLPAETFSKLANVENPELYAIFPYRLYTKASEYNDLQTGINTWKSRKHRDNIGWQQQPIQAAMLGLTSEAKSLVVDRVRNTAAGYRFPGFYGPNYDWTPDQDQPAVFVTGLQRMLMQCEGDKILLFPAWPVEWNVNFKLHAPKNTTVECELKNGKIVKLKVSPVTREKDVINCLK